MSRKVLRRVARLEEALAPPPQENIALVVGRGSSPEDRAEGDARVKELHNEPHDPHA